MPLVVMCGIPGSGKTTRAKQLQKYLTQKYKQNVVIVNQQSLKVNKDQSYLCKFYQLLYRMDYLASHEQKMMRGKIKFQVEKNLTGNTIVIADSLNYIKGYRYQMHCIAREQKTTYCVIYCNTSQETAKKYNQLNTEKFSQNILQDLAKRMQPPHMKNRWDFPLFQRRQQQQTPLQQIAQCLLFQSKKSKDPVSTKQDQKLGQNYLYQLDKICQQVCDQAVMAKIKLKNTWTAMQLKIVKKDFVGMIKEKPIALKIIKQSFLNYLIEADKRK